MVVKHMETFQNAGALTMFSSFTVFTDIYYMCTVLRLRGLKLLTRLCNVVVLQCSYSSVICGGCI